MIERISFILLANLLFYLKTITFKYVSDDLPASRRPRNPVKWRHWLAVLEGHERHCPQSDHALTTGIHAIACAMIYVAFGADDTSFWAAMLFSFNPITNQGSVWIAGRHYVMPVIAILATLIFPYIAPLTLLWATFYNQGFISPLALLGSPTPWVVAFLPFCWIFHFKRIKANVIIKAQKELFYEDRQIKPQKIVLAIKTFGFYLVHTLIPIKHTFYHSFLQSAAGTGKDKAYTMKCRFFWLGLFSLAGMIAYWAMVPWNLASFGMLWWCFGIAPFVNVIRIHQEIAERYCYVPGVGVMVALSYFLATLPHLRPVFLAMYATKMWFYMDAYHDDYFLVEYSRILSPQSWFAWHVAGMKRWDAGSHKEAIILWTMARMISPKEFKINFNLATALTMAQHGKEGLGFLKLAEDNIPRGQEEQCHKLLTDFRAGKMAILL